MLLTEMDVQKLYDKNKKLKKVDIVALQDWIKKQPHLPPLKEYELIYFLHSCYFSLEKTKETIDNFWTIKTQCPELFGKKDPAEFTQAINESAYVPLPQLTPEGYQVVYIKLLDCDPHTYIPENHIKYLNTSIFLWLLEIGTVEGVIIVIDINGVTLAHVTRVSLITIKKTIFFLQEALPVRLKGIHCINTAPFIDTAITIVKPFLKKELINLLHFHHKIETLYKYVPLECLPSDMGGNAKSLSELHEATKKRIADNADYIEEFEKVVVDENKRVGKTNNVKTLFGTEGSFRKLDID
ncbi:hypothetical protein FQA39_LY16985 [Lamprigera yunnana]|nr:hypothetical protein FQA39_LY16985 [Lamprigera yunnana]